MIVIYWTCGWTNNQAQIKHKSGIRTFFILFSALPTMEEDLWGVDPLKARFQPRATMALRASATGASRYDLKNERWCCWHLKKSCVWVVKSRTTDNKKRPRTIGLFKYVVYVLKPCSRCYWYFLDKPVTGNRPHFQPQRKLYGDENFQVISLLPFNVVQRHVRH